MMSDLLRKKSKSIKRPDTIQPQATFQLNNTKEDVIVEKPAKKQKSHISTSVRVSPEVQNKLNSLVTLGVGDNANTVIDILMDEYITSMLSKEEKKQLKFMLDIYANKKR